MLSEQDKAILDDLCALNGVDEVVHYLSFVPNHLPLATPNKYQRACAIAFRLMQEPENVKVQIVKDL